MTDRIFLACADRRVRFCRMFGENDLGDHLRLLQSIINTSVDLIFVKDRNLRTVLCNEAFARAIGKAPEETYGKTDVENGWDPELIRGNPEKGIRGFENDDRQALSGVAVHNPCDPANVAGQIEYFDTYKLPLCDEDGSVVGVLGISRNIAERLRTENALRLARERYRIATRAGRVAAWSVNLLDGTIESDGLLEEMLGFPASEDTAFNPLLECVHPDDKVWTQKKWDDLLAGRIDRYDLEHRMIGRDGQVLWFEIRGLPIIEQGRITGVTGTTRDVTLEIQQREQRRRSESEFRNVIESAPIPLALNDSDGNVLYLNAAFVRTFGYDRSELRSLEDWWPLAYPDAAYRAEVSSAWQSRLGAALRGGRAFEPMEVRIRAKDGSEHTVLASAGISAEHDRVHPVWLFDITERMRAEEGLQRADKLNALGRLAGGLAHDFNNILASFFGYVDLARQRTTDPEGASFLSRAVSALDRAKMLTQQLLTFSTGGTPAIRAASIETVIQDTCGTALAGSRVTCKCEFAGDLLPALQDPAQINQAVLQILLNAREAMEDGGHISIRVQNRTLEQSPAMKAGAYVEILIEDNGPGIPPEQLPRIFDPFFTTRVGSRGLGLATCYSIINRHHGTVEVESTPGHGTRVRILLPAAEQREPAPALPLKIDAPPRGGRRVLVMDDEEMIREVAEIFLSRAGCTVLLARDGREALELCAKSEATGEPVSAALLDLTIPGGMGGREAASEMRKRFPSLRMIAFSGYSNDPVMAEPQKFGFVASLAKPFRGPDLTALVEECLG